MVAPPGTRVAPGPAMFVAMILENGVALAALFIVACTFWRLTVGIVEVVDEQNVLNNEQERMASWFDIVVGTDGPPIASVPFAPPNGT